MRKLINKWTILGLLILLVLIAAFMVQDWHQLWTIASAPDNVPIVAMLFLVPFFTWLGIRQAVANDRLVTELEGDAKLAKTHHRKAEPWRPGWAKELHVWPYLVRVEFLATLIVTVVLFVWSITLNAPLEEPANPNLTMNPSKAPWYFLGLQEMLVYFDPWIAGVVMPSIIMVGLMVFPYVDSNPLGNGYYTLRQRRFLANPKGSKDYILGPTAWRLSRRYGRAVLGTFFHHYLQELSATLGETSHFAVREGIEVFFIDHHIPVGQIVSVAGQTGEFAPLHCTAHGKALLADCDLNALRDLLGRAPLKGYTRTTVRSLTRLAQVCGQVRVDGYALDEGEYLEEVRCVAAPIKDPQGEIVASVGISSPLTRLHTRGVARATAEVRKTACAITASLAR